MAKFYRIKKTGNIVEEVFTKVEEECEGRQLLVANTNDGAAEKHVPVCEVKNNVCTVTVGSVMHPMTKEHYIVFVQIVTNMGVKRVDLTPDAYPVAVFGLLDGEKVQEVYAFCNLHGLWKA